MPARDLFRLELPDDTEPADGAPGDGEVVPFPSPPPPAVSDAGTGEVERVARQALAERVKPSFERFATGWRAAWVGDGILGMHPRPVADLARQFWTDPKPYIKDALVLRIPYALYGIPVIAFTAVAHLLLLIVSYPSLLAGTGLLVLFISLFL